MTAVAWMLFWVIPILAVTIPFAVINYRNAGKRHLAARQWAVLNHSIYMASNPAMAMYFRGRPFVGGASAQVADFIEGKTPKGRPFCSFQYSYVVSSGKSSSTVYVAATAIRLPAVLPQLTVSNETIGDKVSRFFGGQDIELESEDFNKMFRVQASSEAFAYGVLTPQAMDWLMGGAHGLVPFAINGADLICWRMGTPDYGLLGNQLAGMEDLVDAIPQGVYDQFAMRAPAQYWWTPGLTTGRPGVWQHPVVLALRR